MYDTVTDNGSVCGIAGGPGIAGGFNYTCTLSRGHEEPHYYELVGHQDIRPKSLKLEPGTPVTDVQNITPKVPTPEGFSFGLVADPLTAGFQATAAFFNFLSTAQGQRVVDDIINFDEAFLKRVHDLFVSMETFIGKKV